ncbi:MAG: hypothetical protein R3D43_13230 [Tepidamorphaceae bacterium]|nr:hypothetical protein [Rhodobiaceae bacterium]MCC0049322.1 hypothetical protein [Rhodobiaceae bacterium]
MANADKTRSRQAEELIKAYRNARDEQRAATESAMTGNSQAGDRMQEIAAKLEMLGIDPADIDGEGADTL